MIFLAIILGGLVAASGNTLLVSLVLNSTTPTIKSLSVGHTLHNIILKRVFGVSFAVYVILMLFTTTQQL